MTVLFGCKVFLSWAKGERILLLLVLNGMALDNERRHTCLRETGMGKLNDFNIISEASPRSAYFFHT